MAASRDFYLATAQLQLKERISLRTADAEMSVVDTRRLPDMPRGSRAIISEDVYNHMQNIGATTNRTDKEISFILYGRTHGQTVIFDRIDYEPGAGNSSTEATFSPRMNANLKNFMTTAPRDGTYIAAHGHTHPRIGNYYMNFSLGDMTSYMQLRKDHSVFNTGQVELCSVLLTGENYNFLFYDGNDYYKFNDAFVRRKDGSLMRLPSYGPDMAMMRTRDGRGW